MFKNPFEFEGRIRRTEYGISQIILFFVGFFLLAAIIEIPFLVIFYIPVIWFSLAQAAKRCHDRGNSGFFQLIPFYMIWMLFAEGDIGPNQYGEDSKQRQPINTSYTNQRNYKQPSSQTPQSNYAGQYDGGHNKSSNQSKSSPSTGSSKRIIEQGSKGYKGNLYK